MKIKMGVAKYYAGVETSGGVAKCYSIAKKKQMA